MKNSDDKERRDRLVRRAAYVGAVLALLCQALPPDHRSLCAAVVKLTTLTCGGN